MPFPDLPPDRIPGSPGHLNDHQLIDQALDYIQQSGYRDDPNFPPLPDVPVLGQSGHVTAHDRILAVLEYVKDNPVGVAPAQLSNTPTGTYKGADGHTYAYYVFDSDGTLSVTADGLADVLLVGAGSGGGGTSGIAMGGGAGMAFTVPGFHLLAGSHPVVVGKGGAHTKSGTDTTVTLPNHTFLAPGGMAPGLNRTGSYGIPGGSGARNFFTGKAYAYPGGPAGTPDGEGLSSAITGTEVLYAGPVAWNAPDPDPNTGRGGNSGGAGADGVVIIRTIIN